MWCKAKPQVFKVIKINFVVERGKLKHYKHNGDRLETPSMKRESQPFIGGHLSQASKTTPVQNVLQVSPCSSMVSLDIKHSSKLS